MKKTLCILLTINLTQTVGSGLEVLLSAISIVVGVLVANPIAGALIGVVVFFAGNMISNVTSNFVSAYWYSYESVPRKDGVQSSNTFFYGTYYDIRDTNGSQVGTYIDGFTPQNWATTDCALSFFTAYYSPAAYTGVYAYTLA